MARAADSRSKRDPTTAVTPDGPSAWRTAGWIAILLAGSALAVLALRFHPVGDYFTETDFYGAYGPGADAIRRGHFDFARYDIHGPVYEWALAGLSLLVPDLFTAARWLSVLSAVAFLSLAWDLAVRRFGSREGLWLVGLVAVNPLFARYGISACSDMLASALAIGCAWAMLAGRRGGGPVVAGVLAALASMTRYNLVALLPAAVVVAIVWPAGRARLATIALLAATYLLVTLPFVILAVRSGHPPGETLFRDAAYYMEDAPEAVVERRFATGFSGPSAPGSDSPLPKPNVLARTLVGIPSHLASDARSLLGWPVTALVLVGLAVLVTTRRASPLLPLGVFAAATFLSLAPVYYSDRYSLSLLPLYLMPAAAWAGLRVGKSRALRVGAVAVTLLGAAASARESVALEQLEYRSIPNEALESGRFLRGIAAAGEGIMARKPHIAFIASLDAIPFPASRSLAELAAYCRDRNVRWIYYSWYEARLRPGFSHLLDPEASVPGLDVVHVTRDKPSVTYRVGAGFGAYPAWAGDSEAKARIAERVRRLMSPGE